MLCASTRRFGDRLSNRTVADVMTEDASTVEEDTRVRDVAQRMLEQPIHRVWVVKGGRPTGVVSAFDLLRLVRDD